MIIGQTISHYSAFQNPAHERNLKERDKIPEELGGGGMGIVYKAHDLKVDRFVTMKFLPADLTHDPEAKERFIQEILGHASSKTTEVYLVR